MKTSVKITLAAPPITSVSVNLPPGTSGGIGGDNDALEYLSDQDIAAGRSPNSTKTAKTIRSFEAERLFHATFKIDYSPDDHFNMINANQK